VLSWHRHLRHALASDDAIVADIIAGGIVALFVAVASQTIGSHFCRSQCCLVGVAALGRIGSFIATVVASRLN
jgi:hypothetical protein